MDFDIPIATICPSCNSPVAGGAKYCAECGARIVGAVAASAPPRLVERKFVTVVFIDMVGSLSIIRDKDPEDAHELLESAMAVMTEAVHAYGGVVADRLGDGIMAIFGAPVSQDDHATRAIAEGDAGNSQASARATGKGVLHVATADHVGETRPEVDIAVEALEALGVGHQCNDRDGFRRDVCTVGDPFERESKCGRHAADCTARVQA